MTGLERLSATTLSAPGQCTTSPVNSEIKDNCLCCLEVHGGERRFRAATSGLWSVHNWNWRPSSINLKCLMERKEANSSLSKVEYFS